MTDFKTDEEKAEELKAWWKENGTSVMAGIALAVAALFGWEYWKNAICRRPQTGYFWLCGGR